MNRYAFLLLYITANAFCSTISNVSLNIDKAKYSSHYSLGIRVSETIENNKNDFQTMIAEYISVGDEVKDSWEMTKEGSWTINPRVRLPGSGFGDIDGYFRITCPTQK